MNKRRRWWTLALAVVGVLLVVGSFVWSSVVVPKLVKYPSDVDETPVYQGTVTLYVDPATTAPLDPPKQFPLEVSRNIKVVGSSSSLVVVKETASLKATGLFDSVQEQQYVMNRRSMQNVKDDRAWAWNPQNVVDRSPDYRINFPLDNKSVTTPIYSNEQAATYDANPDPANPSGTIEGLPVHNFVADYGFKPASEAYLAALDTSLSAPLPRQLTLDKLGPLLATAGIDISKLLPALLPALSDADRNTIVALAQQPVKLVYQYKGSGADAAETSTGGIVEVRDVKQTLAASPDPSLAPALTALLSRYTQVAGVPEAIANFQKLAAQPITIFENTFSQTPASVKDIAASVRDNADSKELAETTVPLVMLVVGGVLAVLGIALFFLWRKRPPAVSTAGPGAMTGDDLGTDPGTAPAVPGDAPDGSMGAPHEPDPHGGNTS
jgi:hypothetical protein